MKIGIGDRRRSGWSSSRSAFPEKCGGAFDEKIEYDIVEERLAKDSKAPTYFLDLRPRENSRAVACAYGCNWCTVGCLRGHPFCQSKWVRHLNSR